MFQMLRTGSQIINNVILASVIFLVACQRQIPPEIEIRGIYGNPKPFWEKESTLRILV